MPLFLSTIFSTMTIGPARKLDLLFFLDFRFFYFTSSLPSFLSCSSFLERDFFQPTNSTVCETLISPVAVSASSKLSHFALSIHSFPPPPPPRWTASAQEWTFHFGIRLIIVFYCPRLLFLPILSLWLFPWLCHFSLLYALRDATHPTPSRCLLPLFGPRIERMGTRVAFVQDPGSIPLFVCTPPSHSSSRIELEPPSTCLT